MKSAQTVVFLVILVVMVFAVTFASMYVRQTPTNPKANKGDGGPSGLRLTFRRDSYPMKLGPRDDPKLAEEPLRSEFGVLAHFDFWFTNDNDQEVRVGLKKKNCTCSEVKLFLAPDGWRRQAAAQVGQRHELMADLVLPTVVAAGADSSAWLDLMNKEGVVIPPGAAGFVRLSWEGRRGPAPVQGQALTAELWTQTPGGVPTVLRVGVLEVDPVHVDTKGLSLETLGAGDASTATMHCWSSTRLDFDFEIRPGRDNPLIVCSKERLTEAEIAELAAVENERAVQQKRPPRPVLSGWRIQVTANERSKDGKRRLDEGPFVYPLTLVPARMRVEHPEVAVHGRVRGDVMLESGDSIRLGEFKVRNGTSREVKLTSERRELGLKVHSHPRFMKVSLEKEGAGAWRLTVTIEPNKVSGSFPRADNEVYRDSAIYLQIEGTGGRRMRIPVSGEGLQ